MTDTPETSSEPQKPATPAPTQQNQGTPQPDNDKQGQQQKQAARPL